MTANILPRNTVTGTYPDSRGIGGINISTTLTAAQWAAVTTTCNYKVSGLPFAARNVMDPAQNNQSSGPLDFAYSQMNPTCYFNLMIQLDNYYLLNVPPPPTSKYAYMLNIMECLLGGGDSNSNNKVALCYIDYIDGVQATTQEDIQLAIENNGQAVFSMSTQGAGQLAALFKNPPSGVLLTCTP